MVGSNVLLVFNNCDEVYLFVINELIADFYSRALRANGLRINDNEFDYDAEVIGFIVKLSEETYNLDRSTPVTTYQDYSILNYLVPNVPLIEYTFDKVSICSFPA